MSNFCYWKCVEKNFGEKSHLRSRLEITYATRYIFSYRANETAVISISTDSSWKTWVVRCSHAIASHYLVFHAAFVRPDDLVQRVGKLCGEKSYDLSHQRKKRIIVEQIEGENANSGKKRERKVRRIFRGERASGARLKERVNTWPRRRLKISVNKKKKKRREHRKSVKRSWKAQIPASWRKTGHTFTIKVGLS